MIARATLVMLLAAGCGGGSDAATNDGSAPGEDSLADVLADGTETAAGDAPTETSAETGFGVAVHVVTTSEKSKPFVPGADTAFGPEIPGVAVLDVSDAEKQRVEGFGAAVTDASGWILYNEMSAKQRAALLESIASPTLGIGLSIFRQPIGASDSTKNGAYSYDDGAPDPTLARFSIAHDLAYVIPTLNAIRSLQPDARFIGAPWSPPAWMKDCSGVTCPSMIGGTLKPMYYATYASYLAKFVEEYGKAGVPIDAITPQNEPGQPADYPSMNLDETEESDFVSNRLAPELAKAKLSTKILGYDWNWVDAGAGGAHVNPFALLADPAANKALAGIAFHCYGGDPATMTKLHGMYPDKSIYVTECDRSETNAGATRGTEGIQRLIRALRNWSVSYFAWQLVLHPDGTPDQGHGCMGTDWHCVPVVSVDPKTGDAIKEWDYAYLGHASKYVRRGAYVIESSQVGSVEDVAFVNPDGTHVLVAYNAGTATEQFQVRSGGATFLASLPARTVATFRW
ncbi:MAG: ricin-type beta-trefoil lectin domain protein [Polyangiales bacterium]